MLRCLLFLFAVILAVAAAPRSAHAQSCSTSVSNISFGAVNTVSGGATVDSTGTLTFTCSNLGLLRLPLPVTVTLCPNLDAGSGGSSGATRLMSGSGGGSMSYQIYQDAARSTPWGSASFLQFGAAPTLTFTSTNQGAISASTTVYVRATPQSSATVGTYTSTFSGENFFWGLNLLSCAGVTVGTTATPPSFTISATVAVNCLVSTAPLNFGTKGLLTAATTASANISVTCTNGAPYSVALDNGLSGASATQRRMTAAGQSITYGLYRDAALSQPWGASAGQFLSSAGTGLGQTLKVYGQVPAQTTPKPGVYTDTVVVTLSY
jgi:spore coat protein U-like protein